MKKANTGFQRSVLSAALLAAFGPAMAADDEVALYSKPESSVSVGVGNWSNDRHQQGSYDGMRESGAYGLFDADVVKRDDATGTWYTLNARNLGLDSRELRLDVLRQGNVGGFFEYSKTPRDNPFTFNTATQGVGTQNLTVGTTAGGTFAAREVTLGTERESFRFGAFKNLMPGVDFKVDFKSEDRKGTRQWGWGSAALFSVEPIDSVTRQFEALLQYTGRDLQLSGGYYGSWYDNHNSVVLERLNGITGGTSASFNAVTPLTLPLDNQAHQIFLDGDYAFTPTTQGTFKLAYTRATQDESLPTWDLAAPNNRFVNAPSHLNGRIDTTLVQLGLSSQPLPKLSLTASLRYNDVKDKTPIAGFVGNNGTGVATVYNTPHSFTTTTGKLEASYRLPEGFKLTGGIDYTQQDRSYPTVGTLYVPFRADVDETTYRVQLRRSLADDLNGTLSFLRSDRKGSSYIAANGTLPYSNQINPIHIANRLRDKWRLALDWTPLSQLALQFRAEDAQDEYPDEGRPYGLKNGSATLYAIDASYSFSENWKLAAWYSNDVTRAQEVGFRTASSGAANATREARIKEVGDSFVINLNGKITSRIEFGAGFDWFRSVSSYPQDLTLAGAGTPYPTGATGPLPDVRNSLFRLKLDGKYQLDKTADIHLDLIHERWRTDDSSWNFANGTPFTYFTGNITCTGCSVTPVGVVDGTTVTAKSKQTSDFIGVRYVYKFQ